MKNDSAKAIAASMGVSKATVSRALNHCGGVDSATRERILAAAAETEVPECAIYSILPDTPGFFWQEIRRGLVDFEDEHYPMKCNVYTRLRDDFSVLAYLRESERAQVLIIAASVTPAVREVLTALLPGRFVLLFSEDDAIFTNGFYLGSNAEADGRAMAEFYASRMRDYVPYLLTFTPGRNRNVDLRADGFEGYLSEAGLSVPKRIEIPPEFLVPSKTFPARMAYLLTQFVTTSDNGKPCTIYSTFGGGNLSLAVDKVRDAEGKKLSSRCVLLCHDVPLVNGALPDGVFAACNQNTYLQGKLAMEAAHNYLKFSQYPPQKRIYVPSDIIVGG